MRNLCLIEGVFRFSLLDNKIEEKLRVDHRETSKDILQEVRIILLNLTSCAGDSPEGFLQSEV
jgi:hypothetical protein